MRIDCVSTADLIKCTSRFNGNISLFDERKMNWLCIWVSICFRKYDLRCGMMYIWCTEFDGFVSTFTYTLTMRSIVSGALTRTRPESRKPSVITALRLEHSNIWTFQHFNIENRHMSTRFVSFPETASLTNIFPLVPFRSIQLFSCLPCT